MPARPAQDLWQQLVDEAGEDEIERAAGVSVAQAEEELAAADFDVAAARAKAMAVLAAIEPGSPASARAPIATPDKPSAAGPVPAMTPAGRVAGLAARRQRIAPRWVALIAAVGVAVIAAVIAIRTAGVVSGSRPGELAKKQAAELRRDAFAACDAQRYRECQDRLDHARALDPEGEQATEVQARRHLLQGAPRGP